MPGSVEWAPSPPGPSSALSSSRFSLLAPARTDAYPITRAGIVQMRVFMVVSFTFDFQGTGKVRRQFLYRRETRREATAQRERPA